MKEEIKKIIKLILIIVLVIVIVILSLLFFSRKCVDYFDPTGNRGGGCFYIWQKGYWSGEDLFKSDEVKGYVLLIDISAFPKEFQGAARAAIEKLKIDKANPDDYYAEITYDVRADSNLATISLIHKDSFKPENRNVVGNPSSKDRVMRYNLDFKKIVFDGLTQ
jgi:hypothetical protein